MSHNSQAVECPVCAREFSSSQIEEHVNRCLFLTTPTSTETRNTPSTPRGISTTIKRRAPLILSPTDKKHKISNSNVDSKLRNEKSVDGETRSVPASKPGTPLAELMRPASLDTYVGQRHVLGEKHMLRELLHKGEVPSIILWGPPGCGKTSLANVIAAMCKLRVDMRFVKLSATMAGISDVKEVVTQARNELKFNRKTILFMDEIHRFNKLQQDTFLPHVESGAITLIGATTENPSCSLNSALLSRCRVIVLEKLTVEEVTTILERALKHGRLNARLVDPGGDAETQDLLDSPQVWVGSDSVRWLAEGCDGDARQALCSLQLAVQAAATQGGPTFLTLDHIKEGIKRSHTLYSRTGDTHYDMISALHKSIRASDDNAALYWLARMLHGGEDPLYIARRLVRAASEDIGLADPSALTLAVSCLQGCQHVGLPECDVILAQCVVYLTRAEKSQEVYRALNLAKDNIQQHKGPLPSVPLPLRNASTKLMRDLGHGTGYNTRHKDDSNLQYMPEGLENVEFFQEP